jgi:carboxyl-terminal processing protease
MERHSALASSSIKNVAMGMLGMFIGALIFVLGVTVGAVLARPGGLLFTGASPFPQFSGASEIEANAGLSSPNEATAQLNLTLINDVLKRLRTQWYGELPTNSKLTEGAIRGIVNSLGDQFTQYVEPKFAKFMNDEMNGSFEGIGATLKQTTGGGIQIVRIFPGAPAEKGGVLPGDVIEAVDGTTVLGLSYNEVAAMVRGESGTQVKLTLRRADQPKPFELTLMRERIDIPVVTGKLVGDGSIGYVSLYDFSQQANSQLSEEINKLLQNNPKGVILDLRDNGGGLLSQAVEVGDLFLKKGPFVIERDFKGNKKVTDTTDNGIAQDVPMVVLVNGGSASASEIVAGALQDYKRATLIGEKTFGKGSVQSPQTLANGGQLRITIERWYTPNDRGIHGSGISPDHTIINTPEDVKAGRDPQLDAAIEFLTTGKISEPASDIAPATPTPGP